MAEIASINLDFSQAPSAAWDALAGEVIAWAEVEGLALRDAVLLVPLPQHLPLARRAFGRRGGWLPRIETLRTLSQACPPGPAAPEGAVSFDVVQDRLRAGQMLRGQPWARQWERGDSKAFEQTLVRLVDCTHRLARQAAACVPSERDAWFAKARALLATNEGPGQAERLLARVALEWVIASGEPASDVLFHLRPSAWIALQLAGGEPLAEALMAAASPGTPCLRLQGDPPDEEDPLAVVPATTRIERAACEDFEDEAQVAAAHLLALLNQGCQPIALIAQDRVLVRRISALLARRQVPVLDETGWKLSTTRAAAGLMALLRAAARGASTDELLDWMKSLPKQGSGAPSREAIDQLESVLRKRACTSRSALSALELDGSAEATRRWALAVLEPFREDARRTLAEWSGLLHEALHASGQWSALQEDVAGEQVLRTLHLDDLTGGGTWRALAETLRLRFTEFVQAVDDALEQAVFEPPAPAEAAAVVVTPLRRALLRPFAAVLLPGSDDRRLGAPAGADPLLGEALSVALGLPSVAQQQREEALALAHLLRVPHALLLHRHHDDGEVLGPSLLLERLSLLRERAGGPVATAHDPRGHADLEVSPQPRPQPSAAGRLPAALSASTLEALRDCPYRFFSRAMLRLQEPDELDDEPEKRDYGTWLHAVLHRFHLERRTPRTVAEDLAELRRLAVVERELQGIDADRFLPFEASFERFAPHYAEWVHERDAAGAVWLEGESDRKVAPAELEGVVLQGRIDRVDRVTGEQGSARQLIDYKTASLQSLRNRVRDPLEDTQLAFYAALESLREAGGEEPLEAVYLALDDSQGIKDVPHPDVAGSARVLLHNLADELRQLRAGAPLPALGEGMVCEHCEARGLCRRDHWSDTEGPRE